MKIRCIHTKITMLMILIVAVLTMAACGSSDVDWLWNDGDSPSLDNEDMIIRVTGAVTETQMTPDAASEPENTEVKTDSATEPEAVTTTGDEGVTETETAAATSSDAETVVETVIETETVTDTRWANAVSYTGEAHSGTDIRYVGTTNRDKIIVIDAGHQAKGNSDTEPLGPGSDEPKTKVSSGTSGDFSNTEEYELNLRVALALRDELIQRGYSVVMIRETHDVDISNAERAQIANDCRADACIRLHANGGETTEKGAMVVCQTKENPFPDCRAVYAESRKLSECLLDAYCQTSGIGRYETLPIWETDTMTGINWSAVPTTILEMGFMSNQEDDLRMAEESFAKDAATGIANGLDNYFAAIA